MRAGFLHYGNYRLSPLAGALVLEAERARLDVSDARLCGIAFPFTIEARRETWNASARVTAPRQPVDEMARCLTGEHLQITGVADLAVELRTQGRGRDLWRNLEGTGRFESRDGRMQKFELIGQILALLSIEDLATTAKDVAEGARGFRYRRIAAAGRLKGGQFTLEEGVFESPSASMAANGTVRLENGETKMTVLVAPFGRVDRVGQLLIVLAVWTVQLAWSRWWTRHFAVGPLEWAWRTAARGAAGVPAWRAPAER